MLFLTHLGKKISFIRSAHFSSLLWSVHVTFWVHSSLSEMDMLLLMEPSNIFLLDEMDLGRWVFTKHNGIHMPGTIPLIPSRRPENQKYSSASSQTWTMLSPFLKLWSKPCQEKDQDLPVVKSWLEWRYLWPAYTRVCMCMLHGVIEYWSQLTLAHIVSQEILQTLVNIYAIVDTQSVMCNLNDTSWLHYDIYSNTGWYICVKYNLNLNIYVFIFIRGRYSLRGLVFSRKFNLSTAFVNGHKSERRFLWHFGMLVEFL